MPNVQTWPEYSAIRVHDVYETKIPIVIEPIQNDFLKRRGHVTLRRLGSDPVHDHGTVVEEGTLLVVSDLIHYGGWKYSVVKYWCVTIYPIVGGISQAPIEDALLDSSMLSLRHPSSSGEAASDVYRRSAGESYDSEMYRQLYNAVFNEVIHGDVARLVRRLEVVEDNHQEGGGAAATP